MIEKLCGWKISHKDKIFYQGTSGNIRLKIKFYSYPEYRQDVKINKMPENFKLMEKGINRFFLFDKIVSRKGMIVLDREFEIYPHPAYMDMNAEWGNVDNIDENIVRKYRESSRNWPLKSPHLREIEKQPWFEENNIKKWVLGAVDFLWKRIKYRENLNERLGAENAYILRRGDCDEFTDLFVSMARMRGIPARRITGFYMHTREEPHAWSEIYLPHGEWVIVDAALRNIGSYTPNYIILKVEEFNSSLPDYNIQWKGGKLKYKIEKDAKFTPILC